MKVDKHTSLVEIQSVFQKQFPHLRLEFYKKAHEPGQGSSDREKLNHDLAIGSIAQTTGVHELHFNGGQEIAELESMFEQKLGLHVQVFRRSGNLWLQTTATDDWTLTEANRKGGHSAEIIEENE